ncbi:hypothetical protein PFISCL1PPCAC_18190, partial [Pristionchus fissidentatus]
GMLVDGLHSDSLKTNSRFVLVVHSSSYVPVAQIAGVREAASCRNGPSLSDNRSRAFVPAGAEPVCLAETANPRPRMIRSSLSAGNSVSNNKSTDGEVLLGLRDSARRVQCGRKSCYRKK